MRHDVFIAGFGGQGVLVAGNLLCYAGIRQGLNVSFYPAYGVEKRGGAATCTVVMNDGDTGSPVVGRPSVSVLLNQLSFDKYAVKVRPGGVCIINSSLVDYTAAELEDIELAAIPMNSLAIGLGDIRMVNMIACGAYAAKSGVLSLASLIASLEKAVPALGQNQEMMDGNIKALTAGFEAFR